MEEFSPPNKMLDALSTIHRCLGDSHFLPWHSHFWLCGVHSSGLTPLRLQASAPRLLPLPARCYNDSAKAATEPDASRNRARNTTKGTAQHEVRSTHGRIHRRRLHRL